MDDITEVEEIRPLLGHIDAGGSAPLYSCESPCFGWALGWQ